MESSIFRYSILFMAASLLLGIELHAYRVSGGGIRYSTLPTEEFVKAMHLSQKQIEHLQTHEVSQTQIKKAFGQSGLKNLKSLGIANPSKADLSRSRFGKAPTRQPVYQGDPMMSKIFNFARMRNLDPFFVMALVRTESNFHPGAKSHVGAMGLMQLMPATASMVAGTQITEQMLTDPNLNLYIGTWHLRDLLIKYRNPITALSAWNAGEGAVQKYGPVPPYPETIQFGADVMRRWREYRGGQRMANNG